MPIFHTFFTIFGQKFFFEKIRPYGALDYIKSYLDTKNQKNDIHQQTYQQTNTPTETQADRHTSRETHQQTDTPTDTPTDIPADRHTSRQTHQQIDTPADRHKQTNRH